MDFLKSAEILLQASLVLAYVVLILSIPAFVRRILLGLRKDKFSCLMCGNCCRFNVITLTAPDIRRIEAEGYTGFVEETGDGEKKLRMVRGRCMFVRDDKCSIYEHRPRVCREFPFRKTLGFIPNAREWSCCPGMKEFKKKLKGEP